MNGTPGKLLPKYLRDGEGERNQEIFHRSFINSENITPVDDLAVEPNAGGKGADMRQVRQCREQANQSSVKYVTVKWT